MFGQFHLVPTKSLMKRPPLNWAAFGRIFESHTNKKTCSLHERRVNQTLLESLNGGTRDDRFNVKRFGTRPVVLRPPDDRKLKKSSYYGLKITPC